MDGCQDEVGEVRTTGPCTVPAWSPGAYIRTPPDVGPTKGNAPKAVASITVGPH